MSKNKYSNGEEVIQFLLVILEREDKRYIKAEETNNMQCIYIRSSKNNFILIDITV